MSRKIDLIPLERIREMQAAWNSFSSHIVTGKEFQKSKQILLDNGKKDAGH